MNRTGSATGIYGSSVTRVTHHHSFNVSVPLKVGRTAPMFVLSFFLHSILLAGSALDSFQCLRSLLIVSFQNNILQNLIKYYKAASFLYLFLYFFSFLFFNFFIYFIFNFSISFFSFFRSFLYFFHLINLFDEIVFF